MINQNNRNHFCTFFFFVIFIAFFWVSIPSAVLANPSFVPGSSTKSLEVEIDTVANREELFFTAPDIRKILEKGEMQVAILNSQNPPFFSLNSSHTLSGLDVDLAKTIAEQLGVKIKFNRSAQTFDEVVDLVYKKKVDMAFSKLSRTLERTKLVSFSEPYVTLKEGLLINRVSLANLTTRSMNEVEIIRNLQGKIGVIKGSSYVDFAKRRFPRADVVELESWEKVIDSTIQGDVVAAYRDEFAIKKTVLSNPELSLSLQTVVILDTKDNISVALPWDSLHLAEFVSQAFETLNIQYSADTLLNGDFGFN